MFQEAYSRLLAVFGGPGFHPVIPAREITVPPAPKALAIPLRRSELEAWRAVRAGWRERLCALIVQEECDVKAALECALALVEEGRWSLSADEALFDDPARPVIDLFAAETGALLAWSAQRFGDALGPDGVAALRGEARRRLFTPCMTQEGYAFLRGEGKDALCICASMLIAAALLENDAARFARLARVLLKALDLRLFVPPKQLRPLAETAGELSALCDLGDVLGIDVREALGDGLDEMLCAWSEGNIMLDPAGGGLEKDISGLDIFRAGRLAQDEAAGRLGAHLWKRRALPASTVSGRLLSGELAQQILRMEDKPPRLRCGASRENLRMLSRTPDFLVAVNGAAGRGNIGDVQLFSRGVPVLCGRNGLFSVPLLSGQEQSPVPGGDCPCTFEMQDQRELISVDMTCAYPQRLGLISLQRTLMVSRAERSIRWVDAVTLREPKEICFRFLCERKPSVFQTAIRFGALRLTWEGELRAETRPLRDGRTLLSLRPAAPVSRGLYTFLFDWAEP